MTWVDASYQPLLVNLLAIMAAMVQLWLLSLRLRDVSIVDIFWGPAFAGVSWLSLAQAPQPGSRALLLCLLATVWGLRLGGFLWWRNHGKPEDRRYQRIRAGYGERFSWVSLYLIFAFQGLLVAIISLPLQLGEIDPTPAPLGWLDWVGTGVFAVGLLFEAIGDFQLARFKSDPDNAGKVMNRGLWRYTRHPNYFGDFLVWWGLYLIAASSAWGVWTFASPLLMTFLLLRFSGVSLLERDISERRPGYRDYMQRTSAFFPWLPR